MAKKSSITDIDNQIKESDGIPISDEVRDEEQRQPIFKVIGDSRIPVGKATGKLWKSRMRQAIGVMENTQSYDAWDEAIRYYKNDQVGKKNRDNPDRPSIHGSSELIGGAFASTENIVFANVSALVPSIYAKNPEVSINSPRGDEDRPFTITAQKLIRTLMQKRTAPGLNLKPKARRAVVMTTLTNMAWIEVGYVRREESSEEVISEIERIASELAEAREQKKIQELEGELQALDEKIDLLQPAGPISVFRHPKDVIVDPDAQLSDVTDAKWIIVREVYETSFINAMYRKKNAEGDWESEYKPSYIAKVSAKGGTNIAGHDEDITNFSILTNDESDYKKHGYDDEQSYRRAQRTICYKVWDRITRRVLLFADNDWNWPIWVWDDPYGLPDFFPLAPLSFHTDPENLYARGEVSYYLDQQDEINKINSVVSKMRHRVSDVLVYNKGLIEKESELSALVAPTTGTKLIGVTLPEGAKVSDMLSAAPIPQVEFSALFDKRNSLDAIDRVSGVPSAVKGVEYKTNTTNRAIESYESSSATRLDEKIDAIEECIGRVGAMVLHMCLQFMQKDDVIRLIGAENAAAWPDAPLSPQEASTKFELTVVGGSSLKPTSRTRKEQAKEIGQILGQFGQASPTAFLIVLKTFRRAYSDEIVLEQSDWDMIEQSIEQQLASPPPNQTENGGGAQSGSSSAQNPASNSENKSGAGMQEILAQVSAMFQKMPEDIRQGVGQEIAKGVPLEEILSKLQQISA